jgi:hypothetical protein
MIDPTNISYEQMVEAAKIHGAKVLSAGEQMKLNKQIEVCKRLRGAIADDRKGYGRWEVIQPR